MKWLWVLVLVLSVAVSAMARGHRPHKKRSRADARVVETFEAAHKVLPQIYGENARTIYCGCRVHKNKIDLPSCGYRVHKNRKRAERLEWEHVVPAHAFGQAFTEWREGSPLCARKGKKSRGRACARTNRDFNLMESDLYNLWPEIGELNGLRNNYSMAEISGKAMSFGSCSAKIADKKFEPMDSAKGTVARVYMYMDYKYPGRGIISDKNRKLFEAWDKQHPITDYECDVGRKVFAIQHNTNPVLAARCKAWPAGGNGPLVVGSPAKGLGHATPAAPANDKLDNFIDSTKALTVDAPEVPLSTTNALPQPSATPAK